MPQTPSSQPKSPVVVGSGKDPEKGFYRDIRMPNGVVRREWSLFSEETKKRHKRKEEEFNDKVGWASKPNLTNIGGAMMATGAAMGAGAVLLARKTPELAAKYAARQREKSRINPVVKRAGPIHHIKAGDARDKMHFQTVTKGQIKRTGNFAGGKGTRPAPQQRMSLTRDQYNARLNPRFGGQSSSLFGGQSSPSLRGQSSSFTPSTAAQREEAIQAMQQRKYGSPLQGQSTNLTAVREEAIQAMQQRKYGSPLQGQTSPLPSRGSTMPQTGNLFDQPDGPTHSNERRLYGKSGKPIGARVSSGDRIVRNPVESSTKSPGRRYTPAGTAKVTGRGTRGVPRPNPRSSMKPATPAAKTPVTQARPTPLNPNGRPTPLNPRYTPTQARPTPLNPYAYPTPLDPNADPRLGRESVLRPDGTRTRYIATGDERMSGAEQRVANGEAPKARIPGARSRPVGNQSAGPASTPQPPSGGTQKSGTRYAPAGTAKATGKGTRGVPRPAPRRNFKPATGAKPTPQFGPTPIGTRPYVPPGQSAVPTFKTPAPMPAQFSQMPKAGGGPTANVPSRLTQSIPKGFFAKYGRTAGKIGSVIATAVGASELYDQLAPKNAPRAPWMSGGDKKAPASQTPAATAPTPGASGGDKPSGGQKPYEPRYFPEAGGNGNAIRKPDSYLGEAFDYSLQKGTTSGTKYLEHMFRRDKVSEDDQQRLRERFNKKVVGDQTLQEYGADKGITQTLEGKKSGLGEALLGKYRDTGTYQGNTKYDVMRAAAEARMARK